MIRLLQPLDASDSKPFKDNLWKDSESWFFYKKLSIENFGLNQESASIKTCKIETIVVCTLKKCYITDILGGSGDIILWKNMDANELKLRQVEF